MKKKNGPLKAIEDTDNVEVRRLLIDRYGEARYLVDSGAEPIDQDEYGLRYRKMPCRCEEWQRTASYQVMCELCDEEPLVMVKVQNSTPEADGSYKGLHRLLFLASVTTTSRDSHLLRMPMKGTVTQ